MASDIIPMTKNTIIPAEGTTLQGFMSFDPNSRQKERHYSEHPRTGSHKPTHRIAVGRRDSGGPRLYVVRLVAGVRNQLLGEVSIVEAKSTLTSSADCSD
jgi:hypothetical protein